MFTKYFCLNETASAGSAVTNVVRYSVSSKLNGSGKG